MLTRTLFSAALTTFMVAAQQPIDFCLGASGQFGTQGVGTSGYHDTLNGLNRVADRAIFYTTTRGLEVCHDDNYITGLEIELTHDLDKDRKGVYVLEVVQPNKLSSPRDKALPAHTVYMPIEGSEAGTCDWIDLSNGITIDEIGFGYDTSLRSMKITTSDKKQYSFGYQGAEKLEKASFKLNGQPLIGFRAQVDTTSSESHINYVTLLFNECNDEELYQMTQGVFPDMPEDLIGLQQKIKDRAAAGNQPPGYEEYGAWVAPARNGFGNELNNDDIHKDYNEQLAEQNSVIMIMMGVLIFVATLLVTTCCYMILKNRGKICKSGKKTDSDVGDSTIRIDNNSFSSVCSDTPTKMTVKQTREAYRARQVPADSISSLQQIGVDPVSFGEAAETPEKQPENQV